MESRRFAFLDHYVDPAQVERRINDDHHMISQIDELQGKFGQLLENIERAPHFEIQEGINNEDQVYEFSSIFNEMSSDIKDLEEAFINSMTKLK